MNDFIEYTGIVISSAPVQDYNRRVVVLTGEVGKITMFARGARKPGNKFMGATEPFSFGHFKVIKGKDAYTLVDTSISKHFEELRTDFEKTIYGSYFLEIAEYFSREGIEAYEEINLIYASLLALISDKFNNRLIRAVYEIKSLVIAGEFPGIPTDRTYCETTFYTVDFICKAKLKDLYSFSVADNIIDELEHIGKFVLDQNTGHRFKSLDLL